MIRNSVIEGLQGFLMKGRQPAGALLLELSPELVDINVHPAKREIRFRNPREMHRFIVGAVVGAIRRHQEQVRSELFAVPGASEPAPVPASVPAPALTERNNSGEDQDKRGPRQHRLASCSSAPSIPDRTAEPGPVQYQPVQQHRQSHIAEPLQNKLEDSSQIRPVAAQPEEHPGQIGQLRSLRYGGLTLIGQFLNLYLLCEHDGQLVVIDQHAAHERILYQQFRSAYEQQKVVSQNLLFPITVELGPDHADTLEQTAEAIAGLGVVVEFFGDTTWVIKAVPAMLGKLSPQDVLTDILDGLASRSSSSLSYLSETVPECIDNLLASMACKAAIKAGNHLRPEEMLELLRQMGNSKVFSHCPHGRPVLKIFSRLEIEKWFRRS
jgi:DNA mismatch repair protein MutL